MNLHYLIENLFIITPVTENKLARTHSSYSDSIASVLEFHKFFYRELSLAFNILLPDFYFAVANEEIANYVDRGTSFTMGDNTLNVL